MKQFPYREAVDKLLWFDIFTRLDIMYAVTQAAKFCNNPGRDHWNAVLYVISYLSNTINYELVYYEDNQSDSLMGYFKSSNEKVLVMYSDAEFYRDTDSYKSVSGYIYMLSNGPISWSS